MQNLDKGVGAVRSDCRIRDAQSLWAFASARFCSWRDLRRRRRAGLCGRAEEAVADILDRLKGADRNRQHKHDADSIKAAMDGCTRRPTRWRICGSAISTDIEGDPRRSRAVGRARRAGACRTGEPRLDPDGDRCYDQFSRRDRCAEAQVLALQSTATGVATFLTELRLRLQVTAQLHREDRLRPLPDFSMKPGGS